MEEYSLTDQSLHSLTMYHNVHKQNTILEEASDFQTENMRYYVEIGTFIKIDFGVRVPGTKSLYVYLSTEVCFNIHLMFPPILHVSQKIIMVG